ncbi:MAG TPA: cytochrome c biogenesis protein CcdA [Trebonia sp.]
MSVHSLVTSGPLILAIPVAAAAGAVTFLSPCCLPLVPGYLSYITGMSGAGSSGARSEPAVAAAAATAEPTAGGGVGTRTRTATSAPAAPGKGRAAAGAALFILGFSFVFATYGFAAGGVGGLLRAHTAGLTQVLGGVTILLGLLFAGLFDRFTFAGRIFRPSTRPQAGLAGALPRGMLFGFGWSPCFGPTLTAVMSLGMVSGGATRGAFLAFVYGLGLGIPFMIVAVAFQRVVNVLGFFRRNARMVSRIGGALLVVVGVLEVTGAWTSAINWMRVHWISGYELPF